MVDNLSGKLTLIVYAEPGFPGAYQKARAAQGEDAGGMLDIKLDDLAEEKAQ